MPLTNNKKYPKAKEKNFFTIMNGHLKENCDGCKNLQNEDEFEVKYILEKVQPLLDEFQDITPLEMPNRLPFL